MNDPRKLLRIAALLGGLAVAAGAFGAHGLRSILSEQRLETWETAARYQVVHAVAMVALAAAWDRVGRPALVARLWLAGIVVFSGSLYVLCLSGVGIFGAITPIGGLCLIAGWAALALGRRER